MPLTLCLEFGSSAGRCACGARDGRDRRPTQLEVATSFHDGDGRLMKSSLLHTDVHFDLDHRSWEFSRPTAALYDKMHTTGLKPALDVRMCQATTPGAQCRELCEKIQVDPFDLLKHFLLKLLSAIYDHLKSLDHKFCIERLVIPLPGMWFHDPEGTQLHNEIAGSIQAKIRRILMGEGIREQQLAFVAEGFLSCRSALKIVPVTTKTVRTVRCGACLLLYLHVLGLFAGLWPYYHGKSLNRLMSCDFNTFHRTLRLAAFRMATCISCTRQKRFQPVWLWCGKSSVICAKERARLNVFVRQEIWYLRGMATQSSATRTRACQSAATKWNRSFARFTKLIWRKLNISSI